ncbi:alpha/beta hydrolase-fold protein [Actinoallomurus purpureus]|uniref:alpha/beta hydrolase n=1 Tax=Actinoallomurus purpureus TaxID=478114 RepID=UPI0020923E3E|nr:alpha/beta hydrolase-fold protein [Actinoallomurus purpureus]MCO6005504.1 alpha/beta hydrolase-fold protein [Actinoallomurus purpureus]
MVSRRAFLFGGAGLGAVAVAGGAGAVLVEEGVLPGKVALDHALGRCGTLPDPPRTPGVVRPQTFRSLRRGTDVTAVVVLPAGVTSLRGLPVAVALHGNGGTGASAAAGNRLDRYLTDVVRTRKSPPFALVAVDGGPSTYWHRRASGDDPLAMITDELLPRLRRQGASTDRFGVIGWSMGGYGALLLAETVGAPRMAAAVASSPALFPSYDNARRTNHQAFDDAADFARNDVFSRLDRLKGVPTRVDCGTSDPFAPMARRLRARLHPEGAMSGGCHDGAFWQRHLTDQLAFLGGRL